MISDKAFKRWLVGIMASWLVLFALLPFLLMVTASFGKSGDNQLLQKSFTLANYREVFDVVYLQVFVRSFLLASLAAFLCLIIGYPFAYIIAKTNSSFKLVFVFLLIVPFWTSSLIRVYSIITIISANGLLNRLLMWMGIIHTPIQILYTKVALLIGLVYDLLPFMILPLYANLEKFDWKLVEAARDLGANRTKIFSKIIIPLSMPGIVSGVILVFLPAMTLFYIPVILGGARGLLLGNLIKDQFIEAGNWQLGSAISVVLVVIIGLLLLGYWRATSEAQRQDLL